MGDRTQRQSLQLSTILKRSSWILLTAQYTAFALLVHYSRIMPPAGGKRYLTSTTVFLNEVIKLAISLTMALYEVSKTAPPSLPATSLFFSLTSAVLSGDSWKLAIPASLYTLSNSLQYVALSNMQSATFQVTYQLKLLVTAVFGLGLLKRTLPLRKWGILLIIVLGVALVQMPDGTSDEISLQDEAAHLNFPRSLEEWNAVKGYGRDLHKRSATYEGIEEDMLTAFPRMNSMVGLLATIGACVSSGLAGVYFEKVLKDSTASTSLWVRNVQLAIYSIFPALFIGVVFLDGEKVAANGFFQGYNWAVWSVAILQALGGIMAAFCISYVNKVPKSTATVASIIFTALGTFLLFDFEVTGYFLAGTAAVLAATNLYGDPSTCPVQRKQIVRPPPIRVDTYEKDASGEGASPASPSPNDFSIKLPTTPFLSDAGLSSSRPTSPGHSRIGSTRNASGGYFDKHVRDE